MVFRLARDQDFRHQCGERFLNAQIDIKLSNDQHILSNIMYCLLLLLVFFKMGMFTSHFSKVSLFKITHNM